MAKEMNFTKTDRHVADTKIWIESLSAIDPTTMSPEDFQKWVVGQFKNELGPLMEASARANQAEVGEVYEHIGELDNVVNELMDHEESYLRAELAEDLTKTLLLGMEICGLLVNFDPNDELGKRKLAETMGAYQQATTVMLDMIEQITEEDDDDDDNEGSGLSDEGGHSEGADGGGEATDGASGSAPDDGSTPRDGAE